MKKYYVMPKNEIGDQPVIPSSTGMPVDMTGVTIVELPDNNGWFFLKNKNYPDLRVARALAAGQITLADIAPARDTTQIL